MKQFVIKFEGDTYINRYEYNHYVCYYKQAGWVKRCYSEPCFEGEVPEYTNDINEARHYSTKESAQAEINFWRYAFDCPEIIEVDVE